MRRRTGHFPLLFVILLAAFLLAALLLFLNGQDRALRADYLASLTPTPSAVPKKVSYQYDNMTPVPTHMVIGPGREGELVKRIQQRLKELGYYQGEVDGQFGPQTKEAVILFQQARNMTADGLVGEETYALLLGDAR